MVEIIRLISILIYFELLIVFKLFNVIVELVKLVINVWFLFVGILKYYAVIV